jgi:hypothetical protein
MSCLPRVLPLCALVGLTLAGTNAFADGSDNPDSSTMSPALDRISIWLGGYYADTSTTIGANTNKYGGAYGSVNLEKDLGFQEHKTVPRARFDFLIGDSQGFSFDYFSINRSSGKTLSDSLTYGGNTYNASASVNGKLNFDFGSASYKWWFGHENDVFGVGLGAAYYRVHAGISGEATFDGGVVGQASTFYNESAVAPELTLGWRHAFSDSVRMYVDASGVKKNGGNLNGHIYNAALGVEWFPWQNIGVGAEYDYTRIRLNDNRSDYNADLAMRLDGPSLFLRLRF